VTLFIIIAELMVWAEHKLYGPHQTDYDADMSKRVLIAIVVLLAAGGFFAMLRSVGEVHKLSQTVLAADTAGQDTAVPLGALKRYVEGHMGTSSGVTLGSGYQRAQVAAQAAATASAANAQIYAAAQAACTGKSDSITQAKCNQDYLAKHLVNVAPVTPVAAPKQSDFQYFFAAPVWSPDLAGALFGGAAIALVLLVVALVRKPR
jgi:hypothetical protein